MSPGPFKPLAQDAFVFRLAETGKRFLPEGSRFPNADLFEPSSADKAAAARRGREPGISVWDRAHTSLVQASRLWFRRGEPPTGVRGFGAQVGVFKKTALAWDRALEVVADPLPQEHGPGAGGHSLMEGLKRPAGTPRPIHKKLLSKLVEVCTEVLR